MDDTPQWLSEDEQVVWRSYVITANLLGRLLDRDLRALSDLTSDDYGVLAMLSESPESRARLGELAHSMRLPKAHLTYRIQRLEKAGLVQRAGCPDDGRGVYAVLTEQGQKCLDETAPGHVASVRRHLFDHLTVSQQQALADAMQAVLRGHESECNQAHQADDIA